MAEKRSTGSRKTRRLTTYPRRITIRLMLVAATSSHNHVDESGPIGRSWTPVSPLGWKSLPATTSHGHPRQRYRRSPHGLWNPPPCLARSRIIARIGQPGLPNLVAFRARRWASLLLLHTFHQPQAIVMRLWLVPSGLALALPPRRLGSADSRAGGKRGCMPRRRTKAR
ncbi:hypothetical protein CDD80_7489 [Ophiocordyceps camponoti-rufipedis]|uniref:Uncharacterized protein n=1 Tax=Ophiocordyceps camponoti-rufipedis TaxID=2004952 RepID=A0A2C5XRD9_9HYPO|nr:hypothetical protein CDD80_7489 [Ophiocordyceps camponoti-rufipedis]